MCRLISAFQGDSDGDGDGDGDGGVAWTRLGSRGVAMGAALIFGVAAALR